MEDTVTASLVSEADTQIDTTTAFQQINHGDAWRMARLGAHNRAYSETSGYIQFDVNLDRKYRVIVKLDADDTYERLDGATRPEDGMTRQPTQPYTAG